MADFLFYVFAALILGSALMVVLNRDAVNAAMFLILAFVGVAGLFVLLEAYFLAVLQILVYAGAVVVLFLFIVMLLNVDTRARRTASVRSATAGIVAFAIMVSTALWLFSSDHITAPPAATVSAPGAGLKIFGQQLFTTYLLPLQVTGFLLLMAMIGVIVLGRKHRPQAKEN
jgi:NADH-quinone oxidoreductase subunit J